jgi:hypothetical protein
MIEKSLNDVRRKIEAACQRAGRSPNEIKLVLVTKEVETACIQEAYRLGVRDFGENRVQEWLVKRGELPADICWHFIGHLQTNKVKTLLNVRPIHESPVLIHSVDSIDLAKEIQKQAEKKNQDVQILIQVNTSKEETKFGFDFNEVERAVSEISAGCGRLKIKGLMTIGPNTRDETSIRHSFCELRQFRDKLRNQFNQHQWLYLSMGMSSDFEIAVEEGANILRVGTAVFGVRK